MKEPVPTVAELLEVVEHSPDRAEIAAGAWLLSELDPEGGYKEQLVAVAERAANSEDPGRAALLVGWGNLTDETNLRPTRGAQIAQVNRDYEHFQGIAARARRLLHLRQIDPLLRDPQVFGPDCRKSNLT